MVLPESVSWRGRYLPSVLLLYLVAFLPKTNSTSSTEKNIQILSVLQLLPFLSFVKISR